jgi:unsaturated chondroitin disaccharide hydrolase
MESFLLKWVSPQAGERLLINMVVCVWKTAAQRRKRSTKNNISFMNTSAKTSFARRAEDALAFAGDQLRRLITQHPDYFPLFTKGGKWKHESESWTNWCEGFLGGMLWILARRTGDPWWRNRAEHYSLLIEHRKTDRSVHDLGFLFMPTWKAWYDLTADPARNDVVIEAGRTLALRFQPAGKFLRSFVAPESLFIDIMMNVEIIFCASEQTGDRELWWIATQHCLTTRRYLVRGDGSTAHEGLFNRHSGEFLGQSTHQGWRNDSSWARGQTWALYGFATAYRYTKDERFLKTAVQCADFYIERTPATGVPPNDWEEPDPVLPYESSAAAIAAAGLLELANTLPPEIDADRYRSYAFTVLDTLLDPEFLAIQTPGWEGILKHGIYHERKKLGVDESVMWGDYYFLSALDKALSLEGRC